MYPSKNWQIFSHAVCLESGGVRDAARERGSCLGLRFFFVEVFGILIESWLHRFCNEQRAPWLFKGFSQSIWGLFHKPLWGSLPNNEDSMASKSFFLAIWKLVVKHHKHNFFDLLALWAEEIPSQIFGPPSDSIVAAFFSFLKNWFANSPLRFFWWTYFPRLEKF